MGVVLAGPPTWRDGQPPTVDSFAAKGVLEGRRTRFGRLERRGRARAVPHPGRAARGHAPAGTRTGSARSIDSWRRVGPRETVGAFELDLAWRAPRRRAAPSDDVSDFPEVREDLAVVVTERMTAAEGSRLRATPVAGCWPMWRCSTSTAIPSGSARATYRCGGDYRAPDRTLTDEEVASGSDCESPHRRARGGGPSRIACRCSERRVHRCAHRETAAPSSAAARGHRTHPAAGSTSSPYPHHRVPLTLEELDLDRHGDVDARARCRPPHGAGGSRRRLRRGRAESLDPQRRLPAARPGGVRVLYREHEGRRRGGVRPAGALPRQIRDVRPGRNPGCHPTRSRSHGRE